jgi:hypothetical protein
MGCLFSAVLTRSIPAPLFNSSILAVISSNWFAKSGSAVRLTDSIGGSRGSHRLTISGSLENIDFDFFVSFGSGHFLIVQIYNYVFHIVVYSIIKQARER